LVLALQIKFDPSFAADVPTLDKRNTNNQRDIPAFYMKSSGSFREVNEG
jgi:hypothetical protein